MCLQFLDIPLLSDQWSPVNPDGKRQYDRRFLLELQNNPLSLKKPESLPNLEVVRDGPGRVCSLLEVVCNCFIGIW